MTNLIPLFLILPMTYIFGKAMSNYIRYGYIFGIKTFKAYTFQESEKIKSDLMKDGYIVFDKSSYKKWDDEKLGYTYTIKAKRINK